MWWSWIYETFDQQLYKISYTLSDQLSFPPLYRTSVLSSPLSRGRRDFHHIVLSSHNTAVPRHNNTGSEHPPKWSLPWGRRDSQHNRCIKRLFKQTEENKRKYLFLYHRYLYIYAFVHMCVIILYIRLFSYWKKKKTLAEHFPGEGNKFVIPRVKKISQGTLNLQGIPLSSALHV